MRIVKNTRWLIEKINFHDKATGITGPIRLWPRQVDALDLIHSELFVCLLKIRQSGFSKMITGADSLCQCLLIPKFDVLMLSKTDDDAVEYLNFVKTSYANFDERCYQVEGLIPGIKTNRGKYSKTIKQTDLMGNQNEIEFENGSRFTCLSAHSGRGRTGDRNIIDEAAFITRKDSKIDLKEVLSSVEPVVEKANGQTILVSTANGLNTFHSVYKAGKEGTGKYKTFFFSCWDDPTMTPEKRLEKEKDLIARGETRNTVNQEYPRNDVEAFIASGSPRFDTEILNEYHEKRLNPIFAGMLLSDGTVEKHDYPEFRIFKQRNESEHYFIFADVAEGLDHGDNSVAKVFDTDFDMVAEWCGKIEASHFGGILSTLGRLYNNAQITVERNKDGSSTLLSLHDFHGYPAELIFEHSALIRETVDDDFNDPFPRFGWITGPKTRPLIINEMSAAIIERKIKGFSKEDIEEFYRFVIKNGKAQAESGYKDDRVITWCIANYLLRSEAFHYAYPSKPKLDHIHCRVCRYIDREKSECTKTGRTELNEKTFCRLFRMAKATNY